MKYPQKVAKTDNGSVVVESIFTDEVIKKRDQEYETLSDKAFKFKYRDYLHTPAHITINGVRHEIQYNFCADTFCGSYGESQIRYNHLKSKPSRYKISNATSKSGRRVPVVVCNEIPEGTTSGTSISNTTLALSNWSIAEEIKRLIHINTLAPLVEGYEFHREECSVPEHTPEDNPKSFYRRGKSTSGSTKYQCKSCKKITNVLPEQKENFNYHQKRNAILLRLLMDLVNQMAVRRTCEDLGIGGKAYYHKMEELYIRCLDFNRRHEAEAMKDRGFNEIWLNTDAFVYNLNNIRKKGKGQEFKLTKEEKKLTTQIIASADMYSHYVFRADVAYDYSVSFDDITSDTLKYHCNHSASYCRKNDRFRYSYAPQPPRVIDKGSYESYYEDVTAFVSRQDYVDGCHVKPTYTAIAHYFLIRQMIPAEKWRIISDDDASIQTSIFRVFADKFKSDDAVYFTCRTDKELQGDDKRIEAFKARKALDKWAQDNGYTGGETYLARKKILEDITSKGFYDYKVINGTLVPVRGKNVVTHPLPRNNEGRRLLNLISKANFLTNMELANMVYNANNRAIDDFFEIIRRRVSVLERPLVSASPDGKSYIYANYNPKYAQMMVTILRTLHNFCWLQKGKTPAQRLGIADKKYELRDIVYFR